MTPAEAVAHMKRCLWTEKAIGLKVNVNQSTINKIGRGDMKPNWELGQALVRLAEETELPPNDGAEQAEAA